MKATDLRYQGTKEMPLLPGAVTVEMVPLPFDHGCWHTFPDSIRPMCAYDPTDSTKNHVPYHAAMQMQSWFFAMPILPCLWKYILLRSH